MSGTASNGFPPTGRTKVPASARRESPSAKTRLLLAVEHALLRDGLARILMSAGIEVIGQAADGGEVLHEVARRRPSVALIDAALPPRGGVALARDLREQQPDLRLAIISLARDDEALFAAMRAGVHGLLDATADAAQLVECVDDITAGEFFVGPRLAGRLLQRYAVSDEHPAAPQRNGGFTSRELDVLELLAAGRTNRQIARGLVITENTVRTHLRSIMQKLNAQNRVQVAAYALTHGLAGPPFEGNGLGEAMGARTPETVNPVTHHASDAASE